jgi:hypothetical protein
MLGTIALTFLSAIATDFPVGAPHASDARVVCDGGPAPLRVLV